MNFKKIFLSALVFSFLLMNCRQEKKDNSLTLAALFLLNSDAPKPLSAAALKSTGQSSVAVGSAIGTVGSAASGGSVSFNIFPHNRFNPYELLADMRKHEFSKQLKNINFQPGSLPTNSGGASCSGTANETTCTGTVNGTAKCDSGTLKMENLVLSYNNKTVDQSIGASTTTTSVKGKVTLDKCASRATNFYDFPNTIQTVSTGEVTIDGKTTMKYNSNKTIGSGSSELDLNFDREFTASSPSFTPTKGTTITFSNLKEVMSVAVVSKSSNVAFTPTTSGGNVVAISFKGDFADTINGSIKGTGTINGESINTVYTYDKSKTYNYSLACTADFVTGEGNCTVTVK